jgi:hypothetical protein
MTQREYCRKAMRRVAEKHQPVESLDKDPEDIDIDEHHENSADIDTPLEFNDPQVELGPDVGQSTYSEGQTRETPDRRARVEEIEDEEAGVQNRWIEDFPGNTGKQGDQVQSYFEKLHAEQQRQGLSPWTPFQDEEEWELAQWLMLNVGQNATDKFLKLPIVSRRA